ncbi:MAG: Ig-like domain-containing protein, partial [Ruminococcus sp.]|nr:Ig-like domain-containing protein [Ruminococcus sp.]
MKTSRVRGINSSAAVPTPSYNDEASQWTFGSFIAVDQFSDHPSGDIVDMKTEAPVILKKPSGKTSADKPSGFKIKSGSGTQADPYTFELVYPPKVDVTGVDHDKTTANIPYGGTETLTATVAPDGATDKTVIWASSDTTVATVDENGVVTAVALGTATITATATNGTAEDTDDDISATCAVTVEKADPTVKTAPAAVADLTYNGEPQDLITAGTSEDGTVQYAVFETDGDGDTPEYNVVKLDRAEPLALADVEVNTIYTPDPEGEYQGYGGVYFSGGNYIIDDITYTDVCMIYNPGVGKYSLGTNNGNLPLPEGCDGLLISDIDSGNVYVEIVNTANPSGEVVIDEEAWVESIPNETDAGEYNVYYRVKGDDNHNDSKPTKIDGVKIAKADPTATAPEAVEDLTYSGEEQTLITEGSSEDGSLIYAVGNNGETAPTVYYDTLPTKTDAGTYYVWYKVIGDDNHNDSKAACITAIINKADPEVTEPTGVTGLVYDGTAKALLNEGSTVHGQMQYAVGTDAATQPESSDFGIDVPEKTDAGTYYVWYRVIGDTNHNDT